MINQELKNQIVGLAYTDKLELSEWLHKQIQLEMADATKKKAAETSERFGSFLDKAAEVTKTGSGNLFSKFSKVFGSNKPEQETPKQIENNPPSSNGPIKR